MSRRLSTGMGLVAPQHSIDSTRQAQVSQRRSTRKSFGTAAPNRNAGSDNVELSGMHLANMYQAVLKLSSQNKITAKNSWNLPLIDHLATFVTGDLKISEDRSEYTFVPKKGLSDEELARQIDFHRAATTLDASVKIWTCRLDEVSSASTKVLGLIARGGVAEEDENQSEEPTEESKSKSNGLDFNKLVVDASSGSKSSTFELSSLSTKKTIEKNIDSITQKFVEGRAEMDPMFHKLSSSVTEGMSGMLLKRLKVQDGCNIPYGTSELCDTDATLGCGSDVSFLNQFKRQQAVAGTDTSILTASLNLLDAELIHDAVEPVREGEAILSVNDSTLKSIVKSASSLPTPQSLSLYPTAQLTENGQIAPFSAILQKFNITPEVRNASIAESIDSFAETTEILCERVHARAQEVRRPDSVAAIHARKNSSGYLSHANIHSQSISKSVSHPDTLNSQNKHIFLVGLYSTLSALSLSYQVGAGEIQRPGGKSSSGAVETVVVITKPSKKKAKVVEGQVGRDLSNFQISTGAYVDSESLMENTIALGKALSRDSSAWSALLQLSQRSSWDDLGNANNKWSFDMFRTEDHPAPSSFLSVESHTLLSTTHQHHRRNNNRNISLVAVPDCPSAQSLLGDAASVLAVPKPLKLVEVAANSVGNARQPAQVQPVPVKTDQMDVDQEAPAQSSTADDLNETIFATAESSSVPTSTEVFAESSEQFDAFMDDFGGGSGDFDDDNMVSSEVNKNSDSGEAELGEFNVFGEQGGSSASNALAALAAANSSENADFTFMDLGDLLKLGSSVGSSTASSGVHWNFAKKAALKALEQQRKADLIRKGERLSKMAERSSSETGVNNDVQGTSLIGEISTLAKSSRAKSTVSRAKSAKKPAQTLNFRSVLQNSATESYFVKAKPVSSNSAAAKQLDALSRVPNPAPRDSEQLSAALLLRLRVAAGRYSSLLGTSSSKETKLKSKTAVPGRSSTESIIDYSPPANLYPEGSRRIDRLLGTVVTRSEVLQQLLTYSIPGLLIQPLLIKSTDTSATPALMGIRMLPPIVRLVVNRVSKRLTGMRANSSNTITTSERTQGTTAMMMAYDDQSSGGDGWFDGDGDLGGDMGGIDDFGEGMKLDSLESNNVEPSLIPAEVLDLNAPVVLVQAERKVNKVKIKYERISKKVDVAALKKSMYSLLGDGSEEKSVDIEPMVLPNVNHKEFEIESKELARKNEKSFFDVSQALPTTNTVVKSNGPGFTDAVSELMPGLSDLITIPFYFITVLHLANEHNLVFKGNDTLDDFSIFKLNN